MKKLTLKQMCDLVDFLSDCSQDYEDAYSERAINFTLKILSYVNEFHYNYEDDTIICDGGVEHQETE